MGKMKEIDRIAEYLHEVCLEQLYDSIDWAIDGIPEIEDLEGDEYNEMKDEYNDESFLSKNCIIL